MTWLRATSELHEFNIRRLRRLVPFMNQVDVEGEPGFECRTRRNLSRNEQHREHLTLNNIFVGVQYFMEGTA
jgi:hypothetical protein